MSASISHSVVSSIPVSVTTAINYWQDKVQTMVIDCYDTVHPETMTAIDASGLDFKLFEFNKGTKGIAVFG